jgi:hypothetical protein
MVMVVVAVVTPAVEVTLVVMAAVAMVIAMMRT